jgi:hypothetical protein
VIAVDCGLGVLENGRVRQQRGESDAALRVVSDLVATPNDDRYLNGGAGVLHERAVDWQAVLATPIPCYVTKPSAKSTATRGEPDRTPSAHRAYCRRAP